MIPERDFSIPAQIEIENPWPETYEIEGTSYPVETITLRCPTILDMQELYRRKVEGRAYDRAILARLSGLPEALIGKLPDPFGRELVASYNSTFFQEDHIQDIQVGARVTRDIERTFTHRLHLPLEVKGETVEEVRVSPPSIDLCDRLGVGTKDIAVYAAPYLAAVLKTLGGQPIDGTTCQGISIQDMNEILAKMDFFSRPQYLPPFPETPGR